MQHSRHTQLKYHFQRHFHRSTWQIYIDFSIYYARNNETAATRFASSGIVREQAIVQYFITLHCMTSATYCGYCGDCRLFFIYFA